MDEQARKTQNAKTLRVLVDAGAFLAGLAFGWLVFDNIALGFLFALVFSGGSEVAQSQVRK